jgi:hypothetical protein
MNSERESERIIEEDYNDDSPIPPSFFVNNNTHQNTDSRFIDLSIFGKDKVLAILGDFFTDAVYYAYYIDDEEGGATEEDISVSNTKTTSPYLSVDYERGIIAGAGEYHTNLIGKTICYSRNHQTGILKKECEVAGLGKHEIGWSLTWTGVQLKTYIEELIKAEKLVDLKLCQLMLSQKMWSYRIANLTPLPRYESMR